MKLNVRTKQLQYTIDQPAKDTITTGIYWVGKAWELVEPTTIQKCFAKADILHTVCDEFTSDSSEDDEIPLSVLRLSKDLFSCEYENLPGIDI